MAFNLYDPHRPKVRKPVPPQIWVQVKKILLYAGITLLVACLALVTISVWPKSPTLVINLGISAKVKVDGKLVGQGIQVVLKGIEPGVHNIEAIPEEKIPFMEADVAKVDIAPGRSESIDMIGITDVAFDSQPGKATIILSSLEGDINLGKTPLKTKLPYGQYDVFMRLPGFPEYTKSFLSSGDEILINTDFDKLAFQQPGARRLTSNLLVEKLRDGAVLKVDGKEYKAGDKALLSSGFHDVCMFSGESQIICTPVMFPSVGKPVEISWPETIDYPCLYFGKDLYTLPNDARYASVSGDGTSLLYVTGFTNIDCIDLPSGEKVWSEKIDRAFDLRPAIVCGADANYIYGMAGVPSDLKASPFSVELKTGSEMDITEKYAGSVLPFTSNGYKAGDWNCYGYVWSSTVYMQGLVSAIEAVTVKNLVTSRFIRKLDDGQTAKFLGVSTSATKDNHPIFLFEFSQNEKKGILILDPTIAVPYKQINQDEWNREKINLIMEEPKPEDKDKGWTVLSTSIDPVGACFDGGYSTGNCFIVYSDQTVAAISYPSGKLKWSRFVDKPRKSPPTISQAKGKNVVILTFPTSPFEYRLVLLTGEQIERRINPLTAEEAIGGQSCPGGTFVLQGNKAVSGVRLDKNGKFSPQWIRTFKDGLLLPSAWGPVYIKNNQVQVLGSHMLLPIIDFSLPGLGTPAVGKIFGDKRFLAIYSESRFWIIDRYGMVKGYFTGIDELSSLESSGQKALLADIDGRKVVIPWPQN
jgi:hypothetical protein